LPRPKISYTKAARTPSKRKTVPTFTKEPQGHSDLTQYVEENRDTGIPVPELIQQFQEYDCDHPASLQHVVAAGMDYKFVRCERCHRVEKKLKPRTR
jgi:hypothetical protein